MDGMSMSEEEAGPTSAEQKRIIAQADAYLEGLTRAELERIADAARMLASIPAADDGETRVSVRLHVPSGDMEISELTMEEPQ